MYRNNESLCCVPETKIVWYINICQRQTNKYKISQKKRSDLWQPEVRGWEEGGGIG